MGNLQEIARLVREELLTLIRPVQLLSVNPSKATGEVAGRFRSNGMLFDYSIKDGTVRYRPLGAGGSREDAVDQKVPASARLDAGVRKPRNCTTGYACGNTCIQKGRTCRAKGGAAAQRVTAIVKYAGGQGAAQQPAAERAAAKGKGKGKGKSAAGKGQPAAGKEKAAPKAAGSSGPGKAPSLQEVKKGILDYFDVKTVAELKQSKEFKMAVPDHADRPLKSKEDWLKLYRQFVKVPENERDLPDGPTVIRGIDVIKNFRPWHVFGLDPKTATEDDIRSTFRKLIMKHHPDKGGDPRLPQRLKLMRDSMLAFLPKERQSTGKRRDGADPGIHELLSELMLSRQALRNSWSAARRDGYREVLQRSA